MNCKTIDVKWHSTPFPHAIIDNFLDQDEFNSLTKELDGQNTTILRDYITSAERKTIYNDHKMGEHALALIRTMGGDIVKKAIQNELNCDITSLGETFDYSGYSPYHITRDLGYLGSHVDHSSVRSEKLRHVANSIFYASSSWEEDWGGETIFFSKNGLRPVKKIKPIPNRLVLFLHSANSFHGVEVFNSNGVQERRTFYHDYYVNEANINTAMDFLNQRHNLKLKHAYHSTTFVPYFPFGLLDLDRLNHLIMKGNLDYAMKYAVYQLNKALSNKQDNHRSSISQSTQKKIKLTIDGLDAFGIRKKLRRFRKSS